MQIYGYLGTLEKSQKIYIKNQRSRSFIEARGGPLRSQGAPRRVSGAAQALAAPGTLLGGSHTPGCSTLALFIPLMWKPQNRSRFSDLRRGSAATLCSSSE